MSYGRRKIYTDATEITRENVADEVRKAAMVHAINRGEIEKLYRVYRGLTDIQKKKKEIRENINHKVTENRAYEIVSFHKGYTFGEAIQYIRRENSASSVPDEAIASDINALNGYMSDADKAACDDSLAEWMYVCGTSYRMALPNKNWTKDGDESPFKIYALDPRRTFVVYCRDVDERQVMSVSYVERENKERVYSVYTDKSYFTFSEHGQVSEFPLFLGMNPIIEYPADNPRLGVFEIVMPLLDALNELQSNRMDDVVQCVNSFLALLGGDMTQEVYEKVEAWKMLCLPEGTDAKYLSEPMRQSDIQTLKDDLYQSILTICGVPNRNGGSSTSDTGTAVIYRDGYVTAEARAKATELVFKKSEKAFLRVILRILRDTVGTKLRLTDIEPHFTRRNYENIASKAQVLVSMLNNSNIHPELAFAYCGMFVDPESAYLQSMAWKEEQEKKAVEVANELQGDDPEGSPTNDPARSGATEEGKEKEGAKA